MTPGQRLDDAGRAAAQIQRIRAEAHQATDVSRRRQTTRLDYRAEALRAASRFYQSKGDGTQSAVDELLEDAERIERWLER